MSFLFTNKNIRLDNLKTRTTINARISVFVICVEMIVYLLLYNLHDCTFKTFKIFLSEKNYLTCLKASLWSYFYRKKYRWFPTHRDFWKSFIFVFRKTTRHIGKKPIFKKSHFFREKYVRWIGSVFVPSAPPPPPPPGYVSLWNYFFVKRSFSNLMKRVLPKENVRKICWLQIDEEPLSKSDRHDSNVL